jgi:hypothetical protein
VWKPKNEKGKKNKPNFRAYYGHLSGLLFFISFYYFSEGVKTSTTTTKKKTPRVGLIMGI